MNSLNWKKKWKKNKYRAPFKIIYWDECLIWNGDAMMATSSPDETIIFVNNNFIHFNCALHLGIKEFFNRFVFPFQMESIFIQCQAFGMGNMKYWMKLVHFQNKKNKNLFWQTINGHFQLFVFDKIYFWRIFNEKKKKKNKNEFKTMKQLHLNWKMHRASKVTERRWRWRSRNILYSNPIQ